MNERAIELYKQASEFAYTSIGKEHANTTYFQGVVAGKYAELIVGECAKRSGELGNPELGQGLMKHFGVKE